MATGRRAFQGGSRASLIASILKDDPPSVSTAQPLSPPAFDRVVRTCLAKDPTAVNPSPRPGWSGRPS
jgi:hypothetical protein